MQEVCIHYAKQFGDKHLEEIVSNNVLVSSKEDAIALSKFFWDMLEASADDRDNGVEVLGELDLQHWMERSMNIFSGYLSSTGYEDEWQKVCDEA